MSRRQLTSSPNKRGIKRHHFLGAGILLILSLTLLTNVYTVGLVKEESAQNQNLKSFTPKKQKQDDPAVSEGGGLRMLEEPEKEDNAPSQVAANLNVLSPHRQLQDNADAQPETANDESSKENAGADAAAKDESDKDEVDASVHQVPAKEESGKDTIDGDMPAKDESSKTKADGVDQPVPAKEEPGKSIVDAAVPTKGGSGKTTAGADVQNEAATDESGKKTSRAYFIKKGNQFYVTSRDALDLHESLPAQTYSIGINPMSGEFFLQTIDPFDIHGKIYGDTKRQAARILQTFLDRSGSTGVLLSGEKGSGKTFLAKYIAIQAAQQHKIPTVVVNQPLSGERFNAFIQSIQQPTVFLFDEFEKIYAEKDPRVRAHEADWEMEGGRRGRHMDMGNANQDSMLTLLDGTYTTKMLFILTTNNKYKVSTHMRNRPGRIFYVIDFAGLPVDFIKEYCNDKLTDKTKIPQVVAVAGLFEAFSFDMLQAMVEEMNRYGETPEQVLDFLNVRPEFTSGTQYLIKLVVGGEEIPQRNIHSGKHWYGNPLVSMVTIYYDKPRKRKKRGQAEPEATPEDFEQMMEEEEDRRGGEIEFTANDIDGMDATTGSFSYWNEEKKARLVLTKHGATMNSGQTNGSLLQKLSQLQAVGGKTGTE